MSGVREHFEILRKITLQADSACNAWYHLRLLKIRDGYVVEKSSGSTRGRGKLEALFRWDLESAERIFAQIVHQKTKANRTRVYKVSPPSAQLDLFSAGH